MMRWVYDGHLGTFYTTDKPMPQESLYCEQCGDYDWEMGGFATLEDFLIAYADVIQLPDSEEWGYDLEYILRTLGHDFESGLTIEDAAEIVKNAKTKDLEDMKQ